MYILTRTQIGRRSYTQYYTHREYTRYEGFAESSVVGQNGDCHLVVYFFKYGDGAVLRSKINQLPLITDNTHTPSM